MSANKFRIFRKGILVVVFLAALAAPLFFVGLEFSATKSALLSALCVAGIFFAIMPRGSRSDGISCHPFFVPLGLFLVWSSISLARAENPAVSLPDFLNLITFVVLFLLCYFSFREGNLSQLCLLLSIPVGIVSVIGILQYYQLLPIGMDRYGAKDPASTLGLSNFAAEYLALALPLITGFGLGQKHLFHRLLIGGVTGIGIGYLLITGSRAGWVGFLAGVAGMVFLNLIGKERNPPSLYDRPSGRNTKRVIIAGAGIGIAAGILFLSPGGKSIFRRFYSITHFQDPSIRFRILAAREALAISGDFPLFGVGPGNYALVEPLYRKPEMERLYQGMNVEISRVHNEYLSILAETGIPAVLFFLGFLGFLLSACLKSLRAAQTPHARLVRLGAAGGIIASLTAGIFSFNLHCPASASLFWITAGAVLRQVGPAIVLPIPSRVGNTFLARSRVALGILGLAGFSLIFLQQSRLARAEIHFREGVRWMALENAHRAESSLSRAISLYPNRAAYYYNRAMSRRHAGDRQAAISDMRRYLEFHPYSSLGHQSLGIMLVEEGLEREARWELKRALEYSPRPSLHLYSFFLNLLLGLRDYTEVVRVGSQALEQHPGNNELILPISHAHFYLRDFKQAARGYRSVLELDPGQHSVQGFLGQIYLERGEYLKAEELIRRALDHNPDSSIFWFHLARAQAGAGKQGPARNSLRKALSFDPKLREFAIKIPSLEPLVDDR